VQAQTPIGRADFRQHNAATYAKPAFGWGIGAKMRPIPAAVKRLHGVGLLHASSFSVHLPAVLRPSEARQSASLATDFGTGGVPLRGLEGWRHRFAGERR